MDTSGVQRVGQPTRDILVTRRPDGDRVFAGFGKVRAASWLAGSRRAWRGVAGVACGLPCAVVEAIPPCTALSTAMQAKSHEYGDCFLDPAALPLDKIKVGVALGGGARLGHCCCRMCSCWMGCAYAVFWCMTPCLLWFLLIVALLFEGCRGQTCW